VPAIFQSGIAKNIKKGTLRKGFCNPQITIDSDGRTLDKGVGQASTLPESTRHQIITFTSKTPATPK